VQVRNPTSEDIEKQRGTVNRHNPHLRQTARVSGKSTYFTDPNSLWEPLKEKWELVLRASIRRFREKRDMSEVVNVRDKSSLVPSESVIVPGEGEVAGEPEAAVSSSCTRGREGRD